MLVCSKNARQILRVGEAAEAGDVANCPASFFIRLQPVLSEEGRGLVLHSKRWQALEAYVGEVTVAPCLN